MNRARTPANGEANTADVVAQYLSTLSVSNCEWAFLGLDSQYCINKIGGAVESFDFTQVQLGIPAIEQLPFLEGLLPGDRKPVVVPNVQFMNDRFVDLHLFGEIGGQWLLFVDRTAQGKLEQRAQQIRLNDDIEQEQIQKKNRFAKKLESTNAYYLANERLLSTYSDSFQSVDEKVVSILEHGLAYFNLDMAFVSCVSNNTAVLEVVVGTSELLFSAGDRMPAEDVPCSFLVDDLSHLMIEDLSMSKLERVSELAKTGIRGCVAASVQTMNGPFGCVCFYSLNPVLNDFNERDEKFLLNIAGLIANLQGNKEQLGFIQAQSSNYQHLFESVPAIMFLCDADGLIISASEIFSQQVGVEPDLVPGKVCKTFFDLEYYDSVGKAIRSGDASVVPATLIRVGREPLEVELNVKEKRMGAMAGIRMVIATDVSDRNQALRDVTEQNKLLESANESLDQFAFVASHDLQVPLKKIQQFSHFLEEDFAGKLDSDGKYYLKVIVTASTRMAALIQDLLSFSRAKKAVIERERIELNAFLGDIVADLDVAIAASGATVVIGDLPTVNASAPLIGQLFNNLIGNAIKYRRPDRLPFVKVSTEHIGNELYISVSDNGIGFDMENSNRIFEPFSRLHNSRDYEGTGIGLAICSAVCEKHNWALSAHSELGKGSTFRIKLPEELSS